MGLMKRAKIDMLKEKNATDGLIGQGHCTGWGYGGGKG